MLADEITDTESFEVWLRERPVSTVRYEAGCLATRAALRAFLKWFTLLDVPTVSSGIADGLPILRALVLSAVSLKKPTEPTLELVRSVSDDANDLGAYAFSIKEIEASWSANAAAEAVHVAVYDFLDSVESVSSAFQAVGGFHTFWPAFREDASRLERGLSVLDCPLWNDESSPGLQTNWRRARDWLLTDSDHTFWIRWYEAILDGRPLTGDWDSHWQLLHDIALIPNEDWEKGAEHVAGLIAEIEDASSYRVDPRVRLTAERLLRASLGRFSFSEIRHLMEMLPFANDLKELKNQEILESFLGEAEEVTWEIELFLSGLKREELKLQGSGGVLTCFESALEEIGKGRQLASINIGRVIVCGERLQHFSTNHDTLQEFGSYSDGLTAAVRSLQGLTFKFFSEAILRMGVLKDIRSSEEVTLGELFSDLSRGFDQIKSEMRDDLVPLAPAAMSVFDTLLDELDGLAKNEAVSVNPAYKSHLRKEFDFNAALVAVSLRLYLEQSKNLGAPLAEVAKGVAISKATTSVEGLIDWLLKAASSTAN